MTDTHATPSPARSSIHQLALENGLQLVWEQDHRQPLVAIEARIKGGLRAEGPYVGTGITHFIEHMLFKGTTSRAPGTIDQEVRRYGGTINAFTSLDTTGVSLFVESRSLKEALTMLADILQHVVVDPTELEKERAVVISEIQMNLDDPDRRIHQLFWSRHLLEHPYRHPILGYQSLLERLTVEDLRSFYAAQYQPQNITIACVGDLDETTFPELAKAIFGNWARGRIDPTQQIVPLDPPSVSAKEIAIDLPVQAAYVMLGFTSTRLADPDLYPLDVLANIIGQGRSSRLYETLVHKQRLAHTISAWNYTPYDPGIFVIQFRTDPEQVGSATQAITEVLEQIKRQGVTEAELKKAKRMVSAAHLFGLQTIEDKAGELANDLMATGDPLFSRHYVEAIEQVTAQQVQQAAQRYCQISKMTTASIRPAQASSAKATVLEPPPRLQVTKTALDNGATTLIGVDRGLPIAAIVVAFRGGVRVETEETQGLSNLVATMLTKGTAHQNASQIAETVESLGGALEPFSGRDGFGVVLQLLSQDLEEGLALMQDLVTQSTFPEEELAIQRRLITKQLRAQDDEIFVVGGRLLRRTFFGRHPYRFDPLGDEQTVPRLGHAQCLTFAKQWVTPSNMVVAVFGDVDHDAVARQLRRRFGALAPTASSWPSRLPEETLGGVQESSQVMDKEQALVMLGFPGTAYTDPDRDAVDVMTAVLSGMAGRLFQAVREQHGLSYTLGAVHVPGWDPGYVLVYAATRPEEQTNVLTALAEQLQVAVDRGFTEAEVDEAKRYLIGLHRMDVQHLVGLARRSAFDELYGLGFNAWTTYEERINAVTVAMVHEAAKDHLTMQRRAQVLIAPNGHAH